MFQDGTARLTGFRETKTFDLLEGLPLIAWYVLGLYRQAPLSAYRLRELIAGTIDLNHFLQLVAMAGSFAFSFLLIYFVLVRGAAHRKAPGVLPRLVAVAGTFLTSGFIYLAPAELALPVQTLANILIVCGMIGAFIVLHRLGKSFSLMPEARDLVTTGPYSVVRHPLYLVELVGVLGLMLQFQQPWAFLLGAAVFGLQFWRSVFEERVLTAAYPDYARYRARTWRFVPYLF